MCALSNHKPLQAVRVLRTCLENRGFLARLAWRSLIGGRQGMRGALFWTVVQPLVTVAVSLTVFLTIFRSRLEVGGVVRDDTEVFMLSAMIPWMLIADVVSRAPAVMRDGGALIRAGASVPLQLLPLGVLTAQVATFLLQLLLLVAWVAATRHLGGGALVLLAGALALTVVAATGLCLLLAPIGVLWRGSAELARLYCTMGIFLAPVFYTSEQMPSALALVMRLNPASHLIQLFRDALFFQTVTAPASWLWAAAFAVLAFAAGHALFHRQAPRLAGRL